MHSCSQRTCRVVRKSTPSDALCVLAQPWRHESFPWFLLPLLWWLNETEKYVNGYLLYSLYYIDKCKLHRCYLILVKIDKATIASWTKDVMSFDSVAEINYQNCSIILHRSLLVCDSFSNKGDFALDDRKFPGLASYFRRWKNFFLFSFFKQPCRFCCSSSVCSK